MSNLAMLGPARTTGRDKPEVANCSERGRMPAAASRSLPTVASRAIGSAEPRPGRRVVAVEARLWQLLPAEFAGIDLSPVTPLGTCSAIAPVSQNRVVATVRNTEVVSDSTNVLAVEAAAQRRRQARNDRIDLAACHRQLRAQVFGPGAAAHFRLFALVSSARDRGSGRTEASMLTRHLAYWLDVLEALLPDQQPQIELSVFDSRVIAERLADTIRPALADKADPADRQARPHARARLLHRLRPADHGRPRRSRTRRRRPHHLDRPADARRQGKVPRILHRHRTPRGPGRAGNLTTSSCYPAALRPPVQAPFGWAQARGWLRVELEREKAMEKIDADGYQRVVLYDGKREHDIAFQGRKIGSRVAPVVGKLRA